MENDYKKRRDEFMANKPPLWQGHKVVDRKKANDKKQNNDKLENIDKPKVEEPVKKQKKTSTLKKIKKAAHGAKSVAQTTLRPKKYAVSDKEFEHRLNICRKCKLAVRKNGKLHTCGPMLEELKQKGKKTCGCVLNKKAKDKRENCPNGYWQKPQQMTIDGNEIQ